MKIRAEEAIEMESPNLGYNTETLYFRKEWR